MLAKHTNNKAYSSKRHTKNKLGRPFRKWKIERCQWRRAQQHRQWRPFCLCWVWPYWLYRHSLVLVSAELFEPRGLVKKWMELSLVMERLRLGFLLLKTQALVVILQWGAFSIDWLLDPAKEALVISTTHSLFLLSFLCSCCTKTVT